VFDCEQWADSEDEEWGGQQRRVECRDSRRRHKRRRSDRRCGSALFVAPAQRRDQPTAEATCDRLDKQGARRRNQHEQVRLCRHEGRADVGLRRDGGRNRRD
jgi:hypothetical protein